MFDTFLRAIAAGMAIATGCCVYASVPDRVTGSLLFALGLMAVTQYKLALYTGAVGLAWRGMPLPKLLLIFAGNLIGTSILFIIASYGNLPCLQQLASIAAAKMAPRPISAVLAASFFCGMLMELGVGVWRKSNDAAAAKSFVTVTAVMVFILTGAEHSIANAFYVLFSDAGIASKTLFILPCAMGNAAGGIAMNRLADPPGA